MSGKVSWWIVKRVISGVEFYCVERSDGYIAYYCDTEDRAKEHLTRLIDENIMYVP